MGLSILLLLVIVVLIVTLKIRRRKVSNILIGEKNNNCIICAIPYKKISSPLPIKNMKFLRDL